MRSGCHDVADVGIMAVAEHCKQLQRLNVSNCRGVTDVGIKAVAENCKQLLQFANSKSFAKDITVNMLPPSKDNKKSQVNTQPQEHVMINVRWNFKPKPYAEHSRRSSMPPPLWTHKFSVNPKHKI